MRIIEIYKRQLQSDHDIYEETVFKEYFNLCRFLHKTNISDEELIELIQSYVNQNVSNNGQLIVETAEKITEMLSRISETIRSSFPSVEIEAIVLLFGEGNIDGHGIIVDNKPYVVIDLKTMTNSINEYDLEAFLIHEIIHAIHYHLSKEMYFGNYNGIKDQYYKRIISEGIATYMCGKLHNGCAGNEFWLGYFDTEETDKWKNHCEDRHRFIAEKLNLSITNGVIDENLYYNLFSVVDPNNLLDSRLGYYYGSKICESVATKRELEDILKTTATDWEKAAINYFEEKTCD